MNFIEVPQFGEFDQLKIREADAPAPGAGELLIDVRAAGINFADSLAVSGSYPNVPSAPYRPGFEVAGEVSVVGEGVDGWKVGDRAMALERKRRGFCWANNYCWAPIIELPLFHSTPK